MSDNKLDLEAIKARVKAATPGPWAWEPTSYDDNSWCLGLTEPAMCGEINELDDVDVVEHVADSGAAERKADAEFIAHARTDVPALVAEVERLREEIMRLTADLEAVDRHILRNFGKVDHACAECVPGGSIIIAGFRCVFHAARARGFAGAKKAEGT